jgi:probable HAF family extracellular repeat protein
MRRLSLILLLVVVILIPAAGLAAGNQQYFFIDLGTLGGTTSSAWAINGQGQVVGTAQVSEGVDHAFFVAGPGTPMEDLGTLAGTWAYSYATGINNNGQIVGSSQVTSTDNHPFFLAGPGDLMRDLGTMTGTYGLANGINASGQVVGYVNTAASAWAIHPFSCTTSDGSYAMTDLETTNTPDDLSLACSINDPGQIVGYHLNADGHYRAFLKNPGSQLQEISTLGDDSFCNWINNNGQIVGWYDMWTSPDGSTTGPIQSFLKDNSQAAVDIGTLGGDTCWAACINNNGQIVGYSNLVAGSQTFHAFLLNQGQTMQDLNALTVNLPAGVTLAHAWAINDRGWIVGDATGTFRRAFLLIPAPKKTSVPGQIMELLLDTEDLIG